MLPQHVFEKSVSGTRKRLTDFTISEISAVDRPANEHARAALMKRNNEPVGFETLGEAIDFLAKTSGSRTEAMSKAARLFPDLLKRHNETPTTPPTPIAKAADAARQLTIAALAIRTASPGMSRTEALSKARDQHPAIYAAMQANE